MSTYFSSDHHFWHENIIRYCNRPFKTVEEMNETLFEKWNARVSPDDVAYIIGDLAMGKRENLAVARQRLNGKIIIVRGNHDRSIAALKEAGFDEVYNELALDLDGHKLYLHHIPNFEKALKYDFHLCGHVHNNWCRKTNIINVGVDVCDFQPLTLSELIARDQ